MRIGANVSKKKGGVSIAHNFSYIFSARCKCLYLYSQPQPSTELMSTSVCKDDGQGNIPAVEGDHPGPVAPPFALSGTSLCL